MKEDASDFTLVTNLKQEDSLYNGLRDQALFFNGRVDTTRYGRKEDYKHSYVTVHDTAEQEDKVDKGRNIRKVMEGGGKPKQKKSCKGD